ncbi:hypothetical protein NSTC731_02252 [Nostoc sp. DSM 114167]|jgi:hypothetical protein
MQNLFPLPLAPYPLLGTPLSPFPNKCQEVYWSLVIGHWSLVISKGQMTNDKGQITTDQ